MRPLRDAGVALSLANLCFFRVWSAYFYGYHRSYFRKDAFLGGDYLALMLDVLLLAALFWVAATLARRSGRPALLTCMRLGCLLVLLLVVNVIRVGLTPNDLQPTGEPSSVSNRALVVFLLLGLPGLYGLWRWHRPLAWLCTRVVLLVSPFVLVTFSQAVWTIVQEQRLALAEDKPAPRLFAPAQSSPPRVLWLVFDGLDQRLALADRPPGLELPEFDRLRHQALYATNAHAPSNATLYSLPSLITGATIDYADPLSPAELMVALTGEAERVPWSRQPNVFSRARQAGIDSAVTGWFHPYCRLFADTLAACSWAPFRFSPAPRNMLERMRDQMTLLSWCLPYGSEFFAVDPLGLDLWPTRNFRDDHRQRHLLVQAQARQMAGNPGFGLVFVHSPVPHGPPIYDRQKGDFAPVVHHKGWYLDNLALADRVLGELRSSLETAGLWDRTALLVSSDHPWQWSSSLDGKSDPRVPFLLKLPGQTEGVTYPQPFNTVLSHDLVLGVLRGELKDASDVVGWLDVRRHDAPIPRLVQPPSP